MTAIKESAVEPQFIKIAYPDTPVVTATAILKLDARALYNLAAHPVESQPGTASFFLDLKKRGAVLHDAKDAQGQTIPAFRLNNQEGQLMQTSHYSEGLLQDPAIGVPAVVNYEHPGYQTVGSISHYQDGLMQDPLPGEPAWQKFDRAGVITGATSYSHGAHARMLQQAELEALNMRKGLIPLGLPEALRAFKL